MSKNSESDEKSENDLSGTTDSDDDSDQEAQPVPEIDFRPQLAPYTNSQSKPDEDFRSKHPLFDAPEMIDDHDELNAQEKLSSDDETDNDNNFDNPQEKSQENNDNNENNDGHLMEHSPHESSVLALPDNDFNQSNLIPQESTDTETDDVPAWRKFSLPSTPEPDDTEIDALIQEQFSISKLLSQIRSS